jgi:hypothetical protein
LDQERYDIALKATGLCVGVAVEAFDRTHQARRKGGITVAVLERNVLKLRDAGNFDKYIAYQQKWNAVVEKLGFPPAACYHYDSGLQPWGTVVVEYRWEDMGQFAATWGRFWDDADCQALAGEFYEVYESFHRELLGTFDELE